jgi:hypothetical protein
MEVALYLNAIEMSQQNGVQLPRDLLVEIERIRHDDQLRTELLGLCNGHTC